MWLTVLLIAGIVFVAIAGVLSGGVFTLVLVPLAAVAAIAGLVYWIWGYYAGAASRRPTRAPVEQLPHSDHRNLAPRPATPNDLVDARQRQQ